MVMPVVIGTIVFVLLVQLYWYDRCLMEQDTAMLSVQAAAQYDGNLEETGKTLKNWSEKNLADAYVGWNQGKVEISVEHDNMKLVRRGRLLTDHGSWNAGIQYENKILHPASFLRLCRKCEKTGKSGTEGRQE